jgi:TorA maturation chaperone TorD
MDKPDRAAIDDALARSVVCRMLSIGFQDPTSDRLRQIGAHDGFSVAIAALSRLARRSAHTVHRVRLPPWHEATADRHSLGGGGRADQGRLESAAARLAALHVAGVETLAASFWRLFGHTTRGLVCACETEYGPDNGFHQPQQLADISGYYLAFGLRPVTACDVRADHIACECEFMDFLNRKQALLLSRSEAGNAETLELTEQAERTFLRNHLGRFGRAFAVRVASEDDGGYFGALGYALLASVDSECARLGVEAGSIDLAVRPDTIDETPMVCGTADELIQIQRRP